MFSFCPKRGVSGSTFYGEVSSSRGGPQVFSSEPNGGTFCSNSEDSSISGSSGKYSFKIGSISSIFSSIGFISSVGSFVGSSGTLFSSYS